MEQEIKEAFAKNYGSPCIEFTVCTWPLNGGLMALIFSYRDGDKTRVSVAAGNTPLNAARNAAVRAKSGGCQTADILDDEDLAGCIVRLISDINDGRRGQDFMERAA